MPIEALCPTCGAVFNLKDEYAGKKVRCKKCEHAFTVGGPREKGDDEDRRVQTRAGAAGKGSSRDDDDDDDRGTSRKGRPAARRRRDDDDDDDDPGRRRKRTFHDDDDDDDDRPTRRARKSSGGGTGKVLAIVGAIVGVLLLVCAGGTYGLFRMMEGVADAVDQAQQQAQQQAMMGGPDLPAAFAPMGPPPLDMPDALVKLRGANPADRRAAAEWLAKQPLDAARQQEVAGALEPLVKEIDEASITSGARALRVWGTRVNGEALAAALRLRKTEGVIYDAAKELMAAIGHLKYEPGADAISRFLPNFFIGDDAVRALDELGPGAEKAVVKYFNHKDGGTRERARGLIQRYGTKPGVVLDQAVADLSAADVEVAKGAAEWLSRPASDEALQLAKAEPARRTAVARGLNHLIDPPPTFFEDTILATVKRWGTADNVPALVHLLTTTPFKKRETADALIVIGPACEAQVKPLISHRDGGVASEAKRILAAIGSTESKFDAVVVDLRSRDGRRMAEAARSLQTTPVDQTQRAKVTAALVEALSDTGPGHTDGDCAQDVALALTTWATKDDGPAVADKVRVMNRFFAPQARTTLIEWMGKEKVEKTIPFLTASLTDKDDWQKASKALQAMGPDLGEKIETDLTKMTFADRTQLAECFKILGAVGTKKSLDLLKSQQMLLAKRGDAQLAQICKGAIDAINARGK
jgi:predicted Zn finger-like uncharacterized protein